VNPIVLKEGTYQCAYQSTLVKHSSGKGTVESAGLEPGASRGSHGTRDLKYLHQSGTGKFRDLLPIPSIGRVGCDACTYSW
jgi:hypothetical protein